MPMSMPQEARNDELKIMETGQPLIAKEEKETWPDGRETWALSTKMPMRDANGKIVGTFGHTHDITQRKQGEVDLRTSEEHFRSLFESMLNGYVYCRMVYEDDKPVDFVYLDVNKSFEPLTGLKNVIGRKASEVIPGIRENDPHIIATYGRVARTGIPEKTGDLCRIHGDVVRHLVIQPQAGSFRGGIRPNHRAQAGGSRTAKNE